ncbi:MAG: hypothetical protein K2J50_05645, partial [Treponemataceae bacterium]|nr:hypothetical protein [Treponemataceae bacterium]
MKRFFAVVCAVLLTNAVVFAQESDDDVYDDTGIMMRLNQAGDQYINIALMVTFPLNFGGDFPLYRKGQLSIGGSGMLGYHRFLTSMIAVGADISFGYHPTLGSNIFTYVPLVVNATVQPTLYKFEFPITVGIGMAMENYINRTYFPGLVLKANAGVFFRATPSWS